MVMIDENSDCGVVAILTGGCDGDDDCDGRDDVDD